MNSGLGYLSVDIMFGEFSSPTKHMIPGKSKSAAQRMNLIKEKEEDKDQ
jgi:hypothetical protein